MIGFGYVCSFIRHETRCSNISRTVWPKITKFYTDIHTDVVYSQTGMTSLAASRRLRNPFKNCTNTRKTGPARQSLIIRPLFILESPKLAGTSMQTQSKAIPDVTSPAASSMHLLKVEKLPQMPHPTALFASSLMQCQSRLQISRLKNIGNVFKLSGVAFHIVPP